MKKFNFTTRQQEMRSIFHMNNNVYLPDTKVNIRFFTFESTFNFGMASQVSQSALVDGSITENLRFAYPVFSPKASNKRKEVIVLLHGLNERSWDKYLCWAESLALQTGKAVILFPIAYHMNRSPLLWSDPRCMSMLVRKRQEIAYGSRSLSFANVALSERLTEDPARFYTSGRQTIEDLQVLSKTIFDGAHPLFEKGTILDFFAYSIGAFLAEIVLMTNYQKLFDRSRLFVFCGGAIFNHMFGESKLIMDKKAYDHLMDFYKQGWTEPEKAASVLTDDARQAFDAMILPDFQRDKRESFFKKLGNRILGVTLKKDRVMPYEGVLACMGSSAAKSRFEVLDFPYSYTHETPFPTNSNISAETLNACFLQVFSKAAHFLA